MTDGADTTLLREVIDDFGDLPNGSAAAEAAFMALSPFHDRVTRKQEFVEGLDELIELGHVERAEDRLRLTRLGHGHIDEAKPGSTRFQLRIIWRSHWNDGHGIQLTTHQLPA